MYDADGKIISVGNHQGEHDIQINPEMDTSAAGMILKKKREMEAMRSGAVAVASVEYKDTVPPRKLTEEETLTLRALLKAELNMPDDSYEEDAADLLDYALDMVEAGKNVGYVMKELIFMEMEVLDAKIAENFGKSLSTYLLGLRENVAQLASKSKTSMYDADGKLVKQWASCPVNAGEPKMDLSTTAAAQRPAKDMQATLLASPVSAKERSKHSMYDENGNLVKQWASCPVAADEEPVRGGLNVSAQAAANRAKIEVDDVLHQKKSGAVSAKERSKHSMYDENGNLVKQWASSPLAADEEPVRGGLNVSAQAAANRAKAEVDDVLHKKKSGGGLGDRLSKYKDFVKPRGSYHHEGDNHDDARMNSLSLDPSSAAKPLARKQTYSDEQRRQDLQAIMRDRSLTKEERSKRLEEVKAKYAASGNQGDEPAKTVKAPSQVKPSNSPGKSATLDEKRRRELQAIMKDRSLDREEKNRRLEEVKLKYDQAATVEPSDVQAALDLVGVSASSFSQKPKEQKHANLMVKAVKETSFKDRMAAFKKNDAAPINCDPAAFYMKQNKGAAARKEAQRQAIEDNKRYDYKYGDGGIVDSMNAEVKAMGDTNKAAKVEAKESAMQYNYNYGDGGVVDEQTADFKAMGDSSKAAKRETKESAKEYNYRYTG